MPEITNTAMLGDPGIKGLGCSIGDLIQEGNGM